MREHYILIIKKQRALFHHAMKEHAKSLVSKLQIIISKVTVYNRPMRATNCDLNADYKLFYLLIYPESSELHSLIKSVR